MNSNICKDVCIASFHSGVEFASHYVYVYLKYGPNKPTLISQLWHGDELVLGNKITSQHVSRDVIGNQILESRRHGDKHTTFAISISQSYETCVQLKDCIYAQVVSMVQCTMHLAWTLHGTNGAHEDVVVMILNVIKVEETFKEI